MDPSCATSEASSIEKGEGKRANSFGWKKQRTVLNSTGDSEIVKSILSWKRIKLCSILDEKISGLFCDGSDCFISVGNRRAIKITIKNKSSVMTFPFAFSLHCTSRLEGMKRRTFLCTSLGIW